MADLQNTLEENYSKRIGVSMEIAHLFQSLVLPPISYGLPVYAASVPELNTVQRFLRRCHKRRFISYAIDIYDLLKKQTGQSSRGLVRVPAQGGGSWSPGALDFFAVEPGPRSFLRLEP